MDSPTDNASLARWSAAASWFHRRRQTARCHPSGRPPQTALSHQPATACLRAAHLRGHVRHYAGPRSGKPHVRDTPFHGKAGCGGGEALGSSVFSGAAGRGSPRCTGLDRTSPTVQQAYFSAVAVLSGARRVLGCTSSAAGGSVSPRGATKTECHRTASSAATHHQDQLV